MRRALAAFAALACATALQVSAATKEEKREDVREAAQKTLNDLYRVQPKAKSAVDGAAGYAVFSNFGMKLFVAGGGKGSGIAVDVKRGKNTYMKMVEVQAGLGFGVKKFRLVWVFDDRTAFDRFVNQGWELGGQASASAQMSGQGTELYAGALSVSPGVWLYQLTGDGLALELTVKGTKYYKDDELN